jgi:hypothetical protein
MPRKQPSTHGLIFKGFKPSRANYMGPGTDVIRNVREGVKPKSAVDRISQKHDLAYYLSRGDPQKARRADLEMLRETRRAKDNPLTKAQALAGIGGKVLAEKHAKKVGGVVGALGGAAYGSLKGGKFGGKFAGPVGAKVGAVVGGVKGAITGFLGGRKAGGKVKRTLEGIAKPSATDKNDPAEFELARKKWQELDKEDAQGYMSQTPAKRAKYAHLYS